MSQTYDADDPLQILGTTIADKYDVMELAGEGGFSVVYKAQHRIWRQPVALKFFTILEEADPEMRERLVEDFVQEGKLMTELSSKSAAIVQARDIGKLARGEEGHWIPYMVLEWLDGVPLDIALATERRLGLPVRSLGEALDLLEPAVAALDVAHQRGIAHRDIKPANFMILGDARSDEGTIKLLDFGIAKVMADQEQLQQQLQMTGQNITAFTPTHGAPEQFSRNYGATGPWTDVYAVALIVAEVMQEGVQALDGETFYELGVSSCNLDKRPTPLTLGLDVPDHVESIFAKALAVQPSDRYATVGDFWRDLQGLVFPERDTWRAGKKSSSTDPRSRSYAPPQSGAASSAPPVSQDAKTVAPNTTDGLANSVPHPPSTAPRSSNGLVGGIVGAVVVTAAGAGYLAYTANDGPPGQSPEATATAAASATVAPPIATGKATIQWAGACPTRMKVVNGGSFEMGSNEAGFKLWKPQHEVTLDTYCLDEHEVTVDQYHQCVKEGGCKAADEKPNYPKSASMSEEEHLKELKAYAEFCNEGKSNRSDHPINCIDWYRAKAYCDHYGLRLPTEAEWEYAARGNDGRKFPWGNDPGDEFYMNAAGTEWASWRKANELSEPQSLMFDASDGFAGTSPVGKFPRAQTQAGNMDMVGNVWEWTNDWYALYDGEAE
ncbi:MAG: bifunctional serine/threonine-protein kinase/formylglycine-generating enzyme family protein, partial [Myxococcota bacterium]